jgi:radical SAM superfamily enzyme YgiQ (UPF0313 family)
MQKATVTLYMPKRFRTAEHGTSQMMPVELLALAGPLLGNGFDVKIVDANVEQSPLERLLEACRGSVCLGISCILGHQILDGLQAARKVRDRHPELPIVWGGWFPSVMPEKFLEERVADLVVVGQGEQTFLEVVERLHKGQPTGQIPGLAVKTDGRVEFTPPRAICDLEELPPMPFSLLDYDTYQRSDPCVPAVKYFWAAARNQKWPRQDIRLFWYLSSWGCPNDCGFCCSAGVTKRRWTALRPERILEELDPLTLENRIDVVGFSDANFFVHPRRVMDFCRIKQDRKMGFYWQASADPKTIVKMDGAQLRTLSQSGCYCLFVGAESGAQETLDAISKRHHPDENEGAAELLVKHDIAPILSYIVGIPGEQPASVHKTLEQCRRIKSKHPNAIVTIFHYLPLPGSGLYEAAVKAGFVAPASLEGWSQLGEASYYAGPTFNNLTRSHTKAVLRIRYFYFNAIELPWQKEKLTLTERILRQTSLVRVRYGLLRMPVEFWAARARARLADKASRLLWQPIRSRVRRSRKIEKQDPLC